MQKYNPQKIEKRWQKEWDKNKIYKAEDLSKKKKFYCLIEFPYPSGAGLHVGHLRSHIAIDIVARKKRMSGYNVMYPIGWDAFGLPTENFAIKTKTHPKIVTENNIKNFTRQIKSYGPSFDWSREINTTDPQYYKWTQWIFLKLFNSFYDESLDKARPIEELKVPKSLNEDEKRKYIDDQRMAYEAEMAINWCPSCKIGLANEEVVNDACERCGTPAEKKTMKQWMLRITKYANRLIQDLETVNYLDKIKTQQVNWIGKSEGATVKFQVKTIENKRSDLGYLRSDLVEVFTTRPDTLFGCTYMVLSPEHSLIKDLESEILNIEEVKKYIEKAKNKSDLDRTDLAKEKTGVELKGVKAINPANNEEIPIWIADYVLASYGTGAIMAVPAHDERDFEFAKKFGIDIKQVVSYNLYAYDKTLKALKLLNKINKKAKEKDIKIWLLGGLACAFYAKVIYRKHDDLDLIVKNKNDLKIVTGILEELNFKKDIEEKTGNLVSTFTYRDSEGMEVDINYWIKNLKGELAISENDFEESKKQLLDCETLILSYEYIKRFKKYQCKKRDKQKDRLDWEFLNGKVIVENGIAVNSNQFNNLTTNEFKKKITNWLEKNNLGKKATNYKLRDWVFSRQHYWGEPIPIVKCKECGLKKLKIEMELNFRDNSVWDQVITGNKTIETRALNPEEKERYFGDIKTGDLIKINNKNTNEFEIIKINKIYNFKNLEELFEKKDLLKKIIPENKIRNFDDLKKAYDFTKDYLNKIQKNGLVGWEFEKINVTENISIHEKNLPLELPKVKNYEPTETGESPLAKIDKWINVKCPKCGNNAKRETDTMPNWAGSSWYFLRYADPKNNKEFVSPKKLKYWMPVDLYNGGMEHTTLHLLYSRFWHKFLFDLKYVNTAEPYKERRSHGMILAEDGQKMSKSRGNTVNPDEVIKEYGADTIRLYEMFMGPYGDAIPWSTNSLIGMNRFLERVWGMQNKIKTQLTASESIEILLHQTIKKVTEDIENLKFNTAISSLMILANGMEKEKEISLVHYSKFLTLFSPFAPHITEELWRSLGEKESIHLQSWPEFDPELVKEKEIVLVVQVNGKLRDQIKVSADISEEEAKKLALESKKIAKWIDGKEIRKIIFIKGRLVNIVT